MLLQDFFNQFSSTSVEQAALVIIVGAVVSLLALNLLIKSLSQTLKPLNSALHFLRNVILPTATLLALCIYALHADQTSRWIKIFETLLGIEIIWFLLSSLSLLFWLLPWAANTRAKVPGLFVDIVRLVLVVLGSGMVIAAVWDRDLTSFLATLGIGSIVIGLALQDTLGNLFSGVALLFEKPFALGDWIQVGDTIGEVIGSNWRSVRLRTRDLDMIVVPNSTLAKERIKNFSRPVALHREIILISFAYQNSPLHVHQIMLEVVKATSKVLKHPGPRVRTKAYQDFSILYELVFFIDDYQALQDICADIMTRIWYAARRHGLTIPYPIRTVYKTEIQAEPGAQPITNIIGLLHQVPLLTTLDQDEIKWLADHVSMHVFSDGEYVVEQGECGSNLYVIQKGTALVKVVNPQGKEENLGQLGPGDFFGERSFMTGDPRAASVVALGELCVLVVSGDFFLELLNKRPELKSQVTQVVKQRDEELRKFSENSLLRNIVAETSSIKSSALLSRLKNIFGV